MFGRCYKKVSFGRFICLGALFALNLAIAIVFSGKVSAESGDWSWADKDPVVYSSVDTNYFPYDRCVGQLSLIKVDGSLDKRLSCIFSGEKIRYGSFSMPSGPIQTSVIGFNYDSKMYEINTPCAYITSCVYSPETDTLITKRDAINGSSRSLVIYKNFQKRIRPVFDSGLLSKIRFNFDDSNPDYILRDSNGYAINIESVGVSNNGRWAAFELPEGGVGYIDLQSLKVRRVGSFLFSYYGRGTDPTTEFAVSNDGRTVTLMGLNSGFSIININSDCGDVESSFINLSAPPENMCKLSHVNLNDFIYHFYLASHPRFSDDGGELIFSVESTFSQFKLITLRANGYGGRKLDYLALGDSYSSGEGEFSDEYYLKGTNDPYEKCHLSSRSYPFLIANSSQTTVNTDNMKSVACSGALIKDVLSDGWYPGQGNRLLNFNSSDSIESLQRQAIDLFIPGRVSQIKFVQKYHPKVITVGISGNDVGFSDKLRECLTSITCDMAKEGPERAETALEIKGMYSKLVTLYKNIHEQSPESRIYAIGYPRIIEPNGDCSALTKLTLDFDERKYIDESLKYLNKVMEAAAITAGIKYVDIENSQGSQVLCGGTSPTSINYLKAGDDFGFFGNAELTYILGQESFHPNPYGHINSSKAILDSVGDIMNNNYCEDGSTICPNDVGAPEPSDYWLTDRFIDIPLGHFVNFIQNNESCEAGELCQLHLDNLSLLTNSKAKVVINSSYRELGTFDVNSDGSLDVEFKLPSNLEEGYHMMHIYGTSYSGESVDLYQGLKYFKPVEKQTNKATSLKAEQNLVSDAILTKTKSVEEEQQATDVNWLNDNTFGTVGNMTLGRIPIKDNKKTKLSTNANSSLMIFYALGIACIGVILWVTAHLVNRNK